MYWESIPSTNVFYDPCVFPVYMWMWNQNIHQVFPCTCSFSQWTRSCVIVQQDSLPQLNGHWNCPCSCVGTILWSFFYMIIETITSRVGLTALWTWKGLGVKPYSTEDYMHRTYLSKSLCARIEVFQLALLIHAFIYLLHSHYGSY